MDKNVLVFNVQSNYGRFRKPYTTTSALTYLCIHPVALKGLIGAILGIKKEDLIYKTSNLTLGIEVVSPVSKDLQSLKLLSLKSGMFHFPANVEFLRNPNYNIYVKWDSENYNVLKDKLTSGKVFFTPYLGVSENVAKISYVGEFEELKDLNNTNIKHIDSIFPIDEFSNAIDLNELNDSSKKYYFDTIPIKNNEKREYTEYKRVLISSDVVNININNSNNVSNLSKIGEKYVYFFK
ncbi:CRISPR-associated protein Cas5h [Methanococcus voltae]|uniref:type I-B CRISPR-associated protein Cas5b n=1 Tax=Methanococcus voltae TaxID=2188 RepID=UPI001AE61177|nr:type I-B CRISPR-associated protein Cas5b [Methanococcus voltae]MBP2143368.1 CRISPR-associated protein Cas5h [Methanococcus voltae]